MQSIAGLGCVEALRQFQFLDHPHNFVKNNGCAIVKNNSSAKQQFYMEYSHGNSIKFGIHPSLAMKYITRLNFMKLKSQFLGDK